MGRLENRIPHDCIYFLHCYLHGGHEFMTLKREEASRKLSCESEQDEAKDGRTAPPNTFRKFDCLANLSMDWATERRQGEGWGAGPAWPRAICQLWLFKVSYLMVFKTTSDAVKLNQGLVSFPPEKHINTSSPCFLNMFLWPMNTLLNSSWFLILPHLDF